MKCKVCLEDKNEGDFYKRNKSTCISCCKARSCENARKRKKLGTFVRFNKKHNMGELAIINKRLRGAKERAVKKGIPFDLDSEWYIENYRKGCAVTGLPLNAKGERYELSTPSIDQIIPSKGYTKDNCRIVCYWYNTAKNQFSDEQVLEMCKLVIANSERE